jgi:hypothetical protein
MDLLSRNKSFKKNEFKPLPLKFEYEEVSMEKVVLLFKPFSFIFYFKIFKYGKPTV